MNIFYRIYRYFGKDMEFLRKYWIDALLTAVYLSFSMIIYFSLIFNVFNESVSLVITSNLMGTLFGGLFIFLLSHKIKRKYRFLFTGSFVNFIIFLTIELGLLGEFEGLKYIFFV
ncbi:MAG: hypothetical protein ACTSYF_15145, partial [Promethearchaeota archaeon]